MKKSLIIMLTETSILWCGCIVQRMELKKASSFAKEALSATKNALDGGFHTAETEFMKYSAKWKEYENILSLSVSHDDLDAIVLRNARLVACLNSGNEAEAAAVIGELCETFKSLENGFRINPRNIL